MQQAPHTDFILKINQPYRATMQTLQSPQLLAKLVQTYSEHQFNLTKNQK